MSNPKCPTCNSVKTCPIVYGYPADLEKYLEDVSIGKIIGGGCEINKNSPSWHCHDCLSNWGDISL